MSRRRRNRLDEETELMLRAGNTRASLHTRTHHRPIAVAAVGEEHKTSDQENDHLSDPLPP